MKFVVLITTVVMWDMKAVKFGYKLKIGNGNRVRFWEDIWFGSAPLATQFWEICCLVNEKNKSVADLWDGQQLELLSVEPSQMI